MYASSYMFNHIPETKWNAVFFKYFVRDINLIYLAAFCREKICFERVYIPFYIFLFNWIFLPRQLIFFLSYMETSGICTNLEWIHLIYYPWFFPFSENYFWLSQVVNNSLEHIDVVLYISAVGLFWSLVYNFTNYLNVYRILAF